jgi:hypothetical protein
VPFTDLSRYAGEEKERQTLEAMNRRDPLIYSARIKADDLLGDRRWFIPKVTGIKQQPRYWVSFNEWLIGGGLENIHD